MAYVMIDKGDENVRQAVWNATQDWYSEGGQLEKLAADLRCTREVLSRLVDALAERGIFTQDQLVEVIRGY